MMRIMRTLSVVFDASEKSQKASREEKSGIRIEISIETTTTTSVDDNFSGNISNIGIDYYY